MTGVTLPTAFLKTDYDPASPVYSYAGGFVLVLCVVFALGILATKAEPALNVLGDTVQALSSGKFTKNMLIWSVCVGVATGMCVGASLADEPLGLNQSSCWVGRGVTLLINQAAVEQLNKTIWPHPHPRPHPQTPPQPQPPRRHQDPLPPPPHLLHSCEVCRRLLPHRHRARVHHRRRLGLCRRHDRPRHRPLRPLHRDRV